MLSDHWGARHQTRSTKVKAKLDIAAQRLYAILQKAIKDLPKDEQERRWMLMGIASGTWVQGSRN